MSVANVVAATPLRTSGHSVRLSPTKLHLQQAYHIVNHSLWLLVLGGFAGAL